MVDNWFPSWCWNQLKWCILCWWNPYVLLKSTLFPGEILPPVLDVFLRTRRHQPLCGKDHHTGEAWQEIAAWRSLQNPCWLVFRGLYYQYICMYVYYMDIYIYILGIIIIQHGTCGGVGWTRQNGQMICTFSCIRENMLHLNHKNKRSEQKNKNTRPENSHLMIVEGPKSWPIDFQYMEIGKATIQTWCSPSNPPFLGWASH